MHNCIYCDKVFKKLPNQITRRFCSSYCRNAFHYKNNIEARKLIEQKRHSIRQEYINRIKTRPCADCKIQYNPWQMHFDHLNPENKIAAISDMCRRAKSLDIIKLEISKCEVVCANCHANRTYKQHRARLRKKYA